MHQPFTVLAEPVVAVLPSFAGDWSAAIQSILPRLAVSAWAELDARRSLRSKPEISRRRLKESAAETARLLRALDMCRAHER
jgi:hypothetical protein